MHLAVTHCDRNRFAVAQECLVEDSCRQRMLFLLGLYMSLESEVVRICFDGLGGGPASAQAVGATREM